MADASTATRGVYPVSLQDPYADEHTQPFWDAALAGHLIVSQCTTCGTCLMPPQPRCFACQGTTFTWKDLPGTGTIYSFTVVRHPLAPHLVGAVPFVSAVIELDGTQGAGARMLANVVDCDPEKITVGDRVQVSFDLVSDTFAVPRFTPLR